MRGRLQGTRQIERERQTRESGIEASSDRGVRLGAWERERARERETLRERKTQGENERGSQRQRDSGWKATLRGQRSQRATKNKQRDPVKGREKVLKGETKERKQKGEKERYSLKERLKEKDNATETMWKFKKKRRIGCETVTGKGGRIREREPRKCLPSDAESKMEKVSDSTMQIRESCWTLQIRYWMRAFIWDCFFFHLSCFASRRIHRLSDDDDCFYYF